MWKEILHSPGDFAEDGELFLSGGQGSAVLREDKEFAGGTVESAEITCEKGTVAIRLLAAVKGGEGVFYYSVDGGSAWQELQTDTYILLEEETESIRLRAMAEEGAGLAGWQLETYRASGYTVTADLSQPPIQVMAADYGQMENPRYEISWKDTQAADTTAAYTTQYRIYRNGKEIGTTSENAWVDEAYEKGAVLEVEKVRTYEAKDGAAYLARVSGRVTAKQTVIEPDKKEGVKKELKEHKQETQLSSLYGGGYTFTVNGKIPSAKMVLNQSLLGKNKLCSLGFEPVNFNTGNFVLEAQDYTKESSAGPAFSLLRTYNTQSTDTDGPFGAKWASEYSQYLRLYEDGTIGCRKADGALILFTYTDAGYVCDTQDTYTLTEAADGTYYIAESGGKTWHFTKFGLLESIEEDGRRITLSRDARNILTKVRLGDGSEIGVETDENGHITKLVQAGGAAISYTYNGNDLVSVTDENGNTVRYSYDGKGRMTAWYDAAGNRQVYNEYDGQDRVICQEDAKEGAYKLEYFEDHTVTTDAEGIQCEIWFDDQMRTVREVDGEGNEYLYSYDEAGNLTGKTDGKGQLTTYTYDENGNQTGVILPDGAKTGRTYDENGNLLSETDGCGNETHYEYDADGNLIRKILPDGGEESYAYDRQGRLIRETNAAGAVTAYAYDTAGNLAKRTDALGNETAYEYDAEGHITAETDALGNRLEYAYDAAGNLTALKKADGSVTSYTYDALGNTASMTDGEGNVTSYTYDAFSNCTEIHYPDGSVETMEYTPGGLLAKKTDALGNATTYEYDAAGNQISETDALGRTTRREYDGNGLVTRMILPNGAEETYTYEETTGLLIETTDTAGSVLNFVYDANGNITAQYNEEGVIQLTAYDPCGRVSETTDALGSKTYYTYDAAGNLTKTTDALGNETIYEYDLLGNLIAETDTLGNRRTYEYDAAGNKISETDARGAVTRYAYDAAGNLIKVTDALGNGTTYAYDKNGLQISMTDACGGVTTYEYDVCGRKVKEILPDGGENTYAYDAAGNLTGEGFPEGGSVSYKYDAAGQQISMTDVFGKQAKVEYDLLGNTLRTEDGEGATTSYTYDAAGRLTRQSDGADGSLVYTYDGIGRIASMQNGEASFTYDYDACGNVIQMTDGNGSQVAYDYDELGRLTETLYADGSMDAYEYDALGRVLFAKSRDGSFTGYTYDACGNIESRNENGTLTTYEYDLLGNVIKETVGKVSTSYEYDACGRVTKETDHEGNATSYEYDVCGRVAAVTAPDGTRLTYGYDRNGRITAVSDAMGNTVVYAYDEADRLTAVTDALGNTVSYTYDAWDNIAGVTDALGNTTQYAYDTEGRLLNETDACGNTQSYEYTVEGWLAGRISADGEETRYTYDASGNLSKTEYADGSIVTQEWDTMGRLLSVNGVDGKTIYDYDETGNLIRATTPEGEEVRYEYDENGNRTALIYPDGRRAGYLYDSFNRLTAVQEPGGRNITYTYDALGRRTEMSDGENVTSYAYDENNRVTEIVTKGVPGEDTAKGATGEAAGTEKLRLSYAYDACGNIISETRTEDGSTATSTYTYDALNRLTSWKSSDGKEEIYAYDAAGNMTAKTADGQTYTMEYDAADRLVSMTGENGCITYAYDADGNLMEKHFGELTDVYTYDSAGRLTAISGYDGSRVRYSYDAAGLIAEKYVSGETGRKTLEEMLYGSVQPEENTASGNGTDPTLTGTTIRTTTYVYDTTQENAQVISEHTDGRATIYTYGLERTAAYAGDAGNQVRMGYAYDARGSVIQADISGVEDAVGEIFRTGLPEAMATEAPEAPDPLTQMGTAANSYRYTPYGEQILENGEKKQFGYLYNGEAYDAVAGSYYLRARFYEPAMMRFHQKDNLYGSASQPQSLNRYAYVKDNPVMYADPSGEISMVAVAGAYLAGMGVGSAVGSVIGTAAGIANSNPQKSAAQYVSGIQSNATYKTITNAMSKIPAGYMAVQGFNTSIKVTSQAQAKAVADAQKAYQVLANGKGDAKSLAEAIRRACSAYAGTKDAEKVQKKNKDYYLYGQYGFDKKTIELLKRLRKNIDSKYSNLPQKERDWLYSRMVGGFKYGDPETAGLLGYKGVVAWIGTAGPVTTGAPFKDTIIGELGISEAEYDYLSHIVWVQNKIAGQGKESELSGKERREYKARMERALGRKLSDKEVDDLWEKQQNSMIGKPDYAHGQITTASILNPYNKGVVHWIATIYAKTDSEGLKDMAGWLGDATIIGENGTTSFGNDDYIVDLDAENITYYMEKYDLSYRDAAKKYYKELESGNTRAKIFCSNHNYKDVKKEVLKRLKVKDMKTLKKKHPDSYRFLISLKKELNEMPN